MTQVKQHEDRSRLTSEVDPKASKGQFRIIGFNPRTKADWVIGDFDTLKIAQEEASDRACGAMVLTSIYDDQGALKERFGECWNK